LGNSEDVDRAVQAAERAMRQGAWSRMTPSQRGQALIRFADVLLEHAPRLAEIEVRDNGKLYAEMSNQCKYLVEWFRYYGGLADKIQGAVPPIDKPHVLNFTRYEPIGVTACITPWNSPLLLLAWKVAPALAAGNAVVIKPSEYTSASTLEFAALAAQAGLPAGLINVVTGLGSDVGEALVTHPLVRKVAFTGGESGGRRVNVAAAADFKHVTLELGGKSANIVFEDARIEDALSGAISGIFAASGQTCIAGSRLLVHESIHDVFVEKLVALASTARFGDPMSPDTQLGPITTEQQYRKVLDYIEIAKNEGAHCVVGGAVAQGPEGAKGFFVQPTIFVNVTPDMRIAQEEVFGPVLSVIKFKDDDDAVRRSLARPLLRAGFDVHDVASGEAALAWLRRGGDPEVLITDLGMGGMDGLQLAAAARALRPALPVLYISGGAAELRGAAVHGATLLKPFTPRELQDRLRQMIDDARPSPEAG
jgi:aldehyde dehydrogenase (NAD+)